MAEISKAEFIDWRDSTVTQYVFRELEDIREQHLVHLRAAAQTGDIAGAASHSGILSGIDLLIAIQYEDLE